MFETLTLLIACLLQDKKTVVLPRKPNGVSDARMATLKVLRVLEFNSQTLKSGVVVLSEDAPRGGALLFVRGAPGAIRGLVRPASVPPDFDQVWSESINHEPHASLRQSYIMSVFGSSSA